MKVYFPISYHLYAALHSIVEYGNEVFIRIVKH